MCQIMRRLFVLCLFLFSFTFLPIWTQSSAAVADDDHLEDGLAQMLSTLWQMDSKHRKLFHEEFRVDSFGEDGGRLVAVRPRPSVLSRPIETAFGQLCNVFQSVNPNQSKFRQKVHQKVESFLDKLDKNQIFKKASKFYSSQQSLPDAMSFKDKIRSLWFLPSTDIPFRALMCHFSASSGNWLSFVLAQQRLDVKRIVVGRESENMALVEFVGGTDEGEEHAKAEGSNAEQNERRHFPLGDSVEFELCAITLCALFNSSSRREQQKHRCEFPMGEENGQMELSIQMRTAEAEGEEQQNTQLFFRGFTFTHLPSDVPSSVNDFSSAISMKRDSSRRNGGVGTVAGRRWETVGKNRAIGRSKSMPTLRGPMNMQQLVDQMWEKDSDRVDDWMVRVNWQQHIPHKSVEDVSNSPFINVTDESFLQRPIYAALVDIYNEQLFHPPVCQGEPSMNAQRRAKFDRLWALITRSDIYRMVYEYLDNLGKVDGLDFDAFTKKLFDRWFGSYTRCKTCAEGKCHRHGGPLGSSGWEHVFSGEWNGEIVDGHHNWVRYWMQEKTGQIEYHGYYVKPRDGNFVGTIQYKWKQYLKRIGGFLIGTSPAFDFSLLTVCILTEPGDRKCKFQVKETPMFVSSFLEDCVIDGSFRHNFCIATAYPGIQHSNES